MVRSGLIPLFLFWVYVTWFIILFGLVWTYTLQSAPGTVPTREDDESSDDVMPGDPQWLLLIMLEVVSAFERGETMGRSELRGRLKIPTRFLQPMITVLQRAELLRPVESDSATKFLSLQGPPIPLPSRRCWRLAGLNHAGRSRPAGMCCEASAEAMRPPLVVKPSRNSLPAAERRLLAANLI